MLLPAPCYLRFLSGAGRARPGGGPQAAAKSELKWQENRLSPHCQRQRQRADQQGRGRLRPRVYAGKMARCGFAACSGFSGDIPGVIVHRAVNTLDAMWGYRNPAVFILLGRAPHGADDVMGWHLACFTAVNVHALE